MFKINRKLEYALIALKHMSEKIPGELTSAKEICETHNAPFDTTSRVLQIMTQQEILRSEHGAQGGYQIQMDLSKISFLKLAEFILGPVGVVNCLHENSNGCDLLSTCNIMTPIVNLNDRLKDFYDTISVKELILSESKKRERIEVGANGLSAEASAKEGHLPLQKEIVV